MTAVAPQRPSAVVGAVRWVSISFVGQLDDGELLTGTPVLTEISTSDLTIDNIRINTGAVKIDGQTVAIGKAVQCRISGYQLGVTYKLEVEASTNASPAQTLKGIFYIPVESPLI